MRKLLALFVLILISTGGYKLWRAIKYPYSVPVSLSAGRVIDKGSDPITVTLHKYNSTREDKYQTTGESISFAFPADMYFYRGNQDGGPQWDVKLRLDYYTFEALDLKLRETEKLVIDMDAYGKARNKITKYQTFINIYSGITSIGGIHYGPVLRGDFQQTGRYCDLTIYDDGSYPIFSDPKYKDEYPFTEGEHFYPPIAEEMQNLSIRKAVKVLKSQDGFYAYCDPSKNNLFCNAKSTFEGWTLKSSEGYIPRRLRRIMEG